MPLLILFVWALPNERIGEQAKLKIGNMIYQVRLIRNNNILIFRLTFYTNMSSDLYQICYNFY